GGSSEPAEEKLLLGGGSWVRSDVGLQKDACAGSGRPARTGRPVCCFSHRLSCPRARGVCAEAGLGPSGADAALGKPAFPEGLGWGSDGTGLSPRPPGGGDVCVMLHEDACDRWTGDLAVMHEACMKVTPTT
ncbi:unnamed protein product, partial [Gulo gulo]